MEKYYTIYLCGDNNAFFSLFYCCNEESFWKFASEWSHRELQAEWIARVACFAVIMILHGCGARVARFEHAEPGLVFRFGWRNASFV